MAEQSRNGITSLCSSVKGSSDINSHKCLVIIFCLVAETIFYGLVCNQHKKDEYPGLRGIFLPLINDDGENSNFTSTDVRFGNGTDTVRSETVRIG